MTWGGWFVMIASVGGVTGLLAWCVYKVMATADSTEHLRSQAEIETPDIKQDQD